MPHWASPHGWNWGGCPGSGLWCSGQRTRASGSPKYPGPGCQARGCQFCPLTVCTLWPKQVQKGIMWVMQLWSISRQMHFSLLVESWFLAVDAVLVIKPWHCLCSQSLIIIMRMVQEIIRGYSSIVWLETQPLHSNFQEGKKPGRSLGFITVSTALEIIITTLAFSLLFLLPCGCLSFPAWPKVSYTVKMFDLVKNVFQNLLALHRQSEINMNKSESLLWGHQYLADFPRGRSSLLFWETALHVPLLCSFQCTCHWKEISPPSVLVFFILLLLHLKSLLVTKQLRTGQRNLLYHGNGEKEKNPIRSPLNAKMVFLKHSINWLCPLCQAQTGNE